MAERLGLSQQRYSLYETGERKIPKVVEKLVKALKRIEVLERQLKHSDDHNQVFGQRWSVEMGHMIKSYLERSGLTQKAFLEKVIADYILSHEHETMNG